MRCRRRAATETCLARFRSSHHNVQHRVRGNQRQHPHHGLVTAARRLSACRIQLESRNYPALWGVRPGPSKVKLSLTVNVNQVEKK
jgi:hypothetical protein